MPARVAQRLDTVLAAEVAHRNSSERARGVSPRERATRPRRTGNGGFRRLSPPVPAPEVAHRNPPDGAGGASPRERATRPRRTGNGGFRWISPRVLAPAGAVVVLVAAGGYFLSSQGRSPQMEGASSGAAPATAAQPAN